VKHGHENKLKLGKIVEKRSWSVIAKTGNTAFLKNRNTFLLLKEGRKILPRLV
jgi:hypothetical protein